MVLGLPVHGPRSMDLGTLWKASWVDTCGFCTGAEMVMDKQQVGSALQVTP